MLYYITWPWFGAVYDSSILITIMSWDYMYLNLSLANEYVGDITIQPRLSSITNVPSGGSANRIALFTSN